jgi:GNAT superfamily N-acetyltransferase
VSALTIRRARPGEAGTILILLRELAVYEKLTHIFAITEETIARDFFGASQKAFCDLALLDGEPVGLATWYWIYASFRAVTGIYLEDLYVREGVRGGGHGKALLAHLARTAHASGGGFVKWSVLDWNKPSIAFYERLGAEPPNGWTDYQLSGEAFARLAGA